MKRKWFLIGFSLGFILGPIAVVEGFGTYTAYRLRNIDRAYAISSAFNPNPLQRMKEEEKERHLFLEGKP